MELSSTWSFIRKDLVALELSKSPCQRQMLISYKKMTDMTEHTLGKNQTPNIPDFVSCYFLGAPNIKG